MSGFINRFFPEKIFAHKIDPGAERRLRLAQARAEESIIRSHVDNALMSDRFPELSEQQVAELKTLGLRFAQPPKTRTESDAASAA